MPSVRDVEARHETSTHVRASAGPHQGRCNVMTTKTVEALLDDIRLLGDEQYALVMSVRTLVKAVIPSVSEEVKYGGILFSADVPFCGVFAYKQHVTLELSNGASIIDPYGHLEGAGKGRRHIKLHAVQQIQEKNVAQYLPLALEAARNRGR